MNFVPPRISQGHQNGFTLIEVLMGVVVLAILVSSASPSLSQFLSSANAKSAAKAFHDTLRIAGAEARTRTIGTNAGLDVTICPLNAAQTACNNAAVDWGNGWVLYVENNIANLGFDALDTVILMNSDYNGKNINITFANPVVNNRITFNSSGPIMGVPTFSPITIRDAGDGDGNYRARQTINIDTAGQSTLVEETKTEHG